MKDYIIKSFEFANGLTTQLITLATVLIGLTVTFTEKFETSSSKTVMISSWIFLLISIVLGLFALMALTGTLGKITEIDSQNNKVNIYSKNITMFSIGQILTFIIGIILIIVFSSSIRFKENGSIDKTDEIRILKEVNYKLLDSIKTDTLKTKNSH